jgi:8-oxo-dGTP pyrophosphatase MutT (NUDIX family)
MKKWKKLDSKFALNTRWFTVRQDKVQLPYGKLLDDYYVWLQGDIALIVPITEKHELVLVRQYKYAVDDVVIEYPAGFVGEHEQPEQAARREMLEETGYSGDHLSALAIFTESPTKVIGRTHVFLALNARRTAMQQLDTSEDIEVLVKPWNEVLKMVMEGKIWATPSVAATFLALKKLGYIKLK